MAEVKMHPDWRYIDNGVVYNRFTQELRGCSDREEEYIKSLLSGNRFQASDIEARLLDEGIITDRDDPDSLISEYEKKARRADDIDIQRIRFYVTERCNMGCPGCFVRFKYRNDQDFENSDKRKAEQTVDFLREQNEGGSFQIHFLGGEPLIGMELIKHTVSYAEEVCTRTDPEFSVTTNATIVTEEIAQYLDEKDFTVGVSFDGWEELNDQTRMYMDDSGTYADAAEGFEMLQQHLDPGAGILITPQPLNIDVLAEVTEHLVQDLDPCSVTINNPFHSDGTWEVNGRKLAEELKKIIKMCATEGLPLVSPASSILAAVGKKKPKVQTLTTPDRKFSGAVSVDGRISYHFMNYDEELFPNPVGEQSDERFEQWATYSGYQHEECRDCIALNTCGGPDPIESYYGTGHVDELELNPERCSFYKHMTRWVISEFSEPVSGK